MTRTLPVLAALVLPGVAVAAPNGLVPVQGVLTDTDGVPIDDTLPVTFRVYTASSGGTDVWNETQDVVFDSGSFTVYLGEVTALDLALFRDNASLWLGIQIDDDAEMDRFQIASVPYAGYAAFAGEAATLNGKSDVDFLPADWTIDPTDITDVCFDNEAELTTLLDDNYRANAWVPDWTEIQNRPSGLDDGDDGGASYTAGYGLDLSPTDEFAVDPAEIEAIATGVCYDTETELTGLLDDNYAVTAGTGISVASNQVSVDATWLLSQDPPWASESLVGNATWPDPMERTTTTLPLGNSGSAHRSVETGTGCYNWAHSNRFPVDPTQTYEFSAYLRAEGADLDNYIGFYAFDSSGNQIAGPWNNPYFKTGQSDPNTWTRWTAYVLPAGTGDTNNDGQPDAAVTSTNGVDWVWPANTVTAQIRFGTCYGDGSGAQSGWFAHPMVRALDVASTSAASQVDVSTILEAGGRGGNLALAQAFQDAIEATATTLPQGQTGTVQRSAENGTGCYEWARSGRFPVNPASSYEYSIWVKSTELDLDNYMGFYVYDAAGSQIAGAWNNPYFKTGQNDPNVWTKWTGMLLSAATIDSNSDGQPDVPPPGTNGVDWKLPSNAVTAEIRYGACYGDGSNSGQSFFAMPMVTEINPQDGWITPAFQGGWTNYGGTYNPIGYYKDASGVVHLRGLVAGGSGSTIFTLPPGYRPAYRELHAVQTNPNTIGRLDILTNGQVEMVSGNNGWFSLDGVTFRAAQ